MHHNSWCLESIGARIGVSPSVPTPLQLMLFMCCVLQEIHSDLTVICLAKCTTITIKLHTGRRSRVGRSLLLHIRDIPGSILGPETYDIQQFFGTLPQVPPTNKRTFSQIDKPFFLHIFFQLTLQCFPRCTAWSFNISLAAGLGAPCTLECIYMHSKFNKAGSLRIK